MGLVKLESTTDRSTPPTTVEDIQTMLADLKDNDPSVRRHAAHGLARAGTPGAIQALCEQAGVEDDDTVLETILTMVMLYPGQVTVESLLPYLGSFNASLRNGVIDVLRVMPEAVEPQLDQVLGNPDPAVRIMGISLLAGLADARVPGRLLAVIRRDQDLNVCAAAVEVLAEVGEADAVPALKDLLEQFPSVPFLEFAVQTAVGRIVAPRELPRHERGAMGHHDLR